MKERVELIKICNMSPYGVKFHVQNVGFSVLILGRHDDATPKSKSRSCLLGIHLLTSTTYSLKREYEAIPLVCAVERERKEMVSIQKSHHYINRK